MCTRVHAHTHIHTHIHMYVFFLTFPLDADSLAGRIESLTISLRMSECQISLQRKVLDFSCSCTEVQLQMVDENVVHQTQGPVLGSGIG